MKTRNDIYYNLELSPFSARINGTLFVFSSGLHLSKFVHRLEDNRERLQQSLERRFKLGFDCERLADVLLYTAVENRGFLIQFENGEVATCLSSVRAGLKISLPKSIV